MVDRKAPSIAEVHAALDPLAEWLDDESAAVTRQQIAPATRLTARYFAAEHPGGAVELRVPPFVAVQCVPGTDHRRGTPPNVIEMAPRTWLLLVSGRIDWTSAVAEGALSASGSRADLSQLLPVPALARQPGRRSAQPTIHPEKRSTVRHEEQQ